MLLDQVSRRKRHSGSRSRAGGGAGFTCSQNLHFSPLGVLRPMFSRLFPPTGRSTQWTVRSGQLGQATAGEPGGWATGFRAAWGRARWDAGGVPGSGKEELGRVLGVWSLNRSLRGVRSADREAGAAWK